MIEIKLDGCPPDFVCDHCRGAMLHDEEIIGAYYCPRCGQSEIPMTTPDEAREAGVRFDERRFQREEERNNR